MMMILYLLKVSYVTSPVSSDCSSSGEVDLERRAWPRDAGPASNDAHCSGRRTSGQQPFQNVRARWTL